ncbi:glycosyltransferase family 2 protein [Streptomyces sp. Mg1]|uniref:glycosyltransferase family 2 protein n=1 Tax=Streptomyces sp. Mg1 TaxID=465541 RepID=UPI002D2194AE|nr:glycosyltransferase family 2 protein [Streptomyces sp. Mg1]
MNSCPSSTVTVVVIAFNDAGLVGEAVSSALAQGPVVREVVAVNDASTDGTGRVLDALAAAHPRLKVVHRAQNSGGCGTPRNDGMAAATAPYVMFLDSDDVLPPGAAQALVTAAEQYRAPVAVGACVRRELPQGRDVPWVPGLYTAGEVIEQPVDRPALVRDTLCVNKLYDRYFLDKHAIRFPDGRYIYEDFVFTARVLAAAPRIAVVGDLVYVWHVRRTAARVSISLDRGDVGNWHSRVEAHHEAARILGEAAPELGRASKVKFLEYDLPIYLRELDPDPGYRAAWWTLTRAGLRCLTEGDIAAAGAQGRWIARLLRAGETPPADMDRLARFASAPPSLLPPYATGADGAAVWSEELPVELDGMATMPVAELPVAVEVEPAGRSSVRIRVHDLYGAPRRGRRGHRPAELPAPRRRRTRPGAPGRAGGHAGRRRLDHRAAAASGRAGRHRTPPGAARDAGLGRPGRGALRRRELGAGRPAPPRRSAGPPDPAEQPVRSAAGAALPDGVRLAGAAARAGRGGRAGPRTQPLRPGPRGPQAGSPARLTHVLRLPPYDDRLPDMPVTEINRTFPRTPSGGTSGRYA